MKKLTLFALTLVSTTMLAPTMDAAAAPRTIDCLNGVYVSVGQGNNFNSLKSSLLEKNFSSNNFNWKDCFPQLSDCPDNNPQFPTPELPGTPELPELPPVQPELPGNPELPETPELPENPGKPENPGQPGTPGQPGIDKPGASDDSQAFAEEVVRLVNQERSRAGVAPLTINDGTETAANKRAKEIETSFSHTRPDGSSFSSALTAEGVSFTGSGENIAWGQKTPAEVMESWMNSSGHRANILNPNFKSIGVGHYQNASGTHYWTQLFIQ